MSDFKYKESKNAEYIAKKDELLKSLPEFCTDYCNAKHDAKPLTLYTYVLRFQSFFTYISTSKYAGEISPSELTMDHLREIDAKDVDEFIQALKEGKVNDNGKQVSGNTINNYISALNSLWMFYYKREKLDKNIISLITRAKVRKEEIDRKYLSEEDTRTVYNTIESGYGLTKHTQAYRTDVSVARDCAIYITLLHTGLRVSELVGLDTDHVHINIDEPFVETNRKEGYIEAVYLSNAAADAIKDYLPLRSALCPDKKEKALFVSTKGKDKGQRLSVRSVQRLVKKYAEAGAPLVGYKISPHRIRATFATMMIEKTGDLSLVQNLMAHKSPDTTSIYIADREKARKQHRNDMQS